MGTEVSTGYAERVALGPESFESAFRDGCIELRSGPQPLTADAAPSGTLLARITRDGGAWTAGDPANGLRFQRAGRYVTKDPAHRWRLVGLASGTIGWMRLLPNAPDPGTTSFTALRVDGTVGLVDSTGDVQFWLPSLSVSSSTEIEITQFWYAVPPLGE